MKAGVKNLFGAAWARHTAFYCAAERIDQLERERYGERYNVHRALPTERSKCMILITVGA